MRGSLLSLVFLLGCATAEDPYSSRLDAASDSETDTVVVDSQTEDTGTPPADSGPCKLVINELQTGDGSSGGADFVEIHNSCSTAASVSNFRLVYRSSTGTTDGTLFTFPAVDTIPGKGYRVIAGTAFGGSADGALSSGLAAGGASVALKDESDQVIDSVAYGSGTGDYVEGSAAPAPGDSTPAKSIARVPNGVDTDDNAADFKVGTPTPGAAAAP